MRLSSMFSKSFKLTLGSLVGLMIGTAASAQMTTLTVYTAVEAEDLKKYAATFNEAHPDIKINWVRDSTGIVTAKLLAEKNNPKADVIWGLAATSLLLMKGEGMLEPYSPKGLGGLDAKFRADDLFPLTGRLWVKDPIAGNQCRQDTEKQKECG